MRKILRGHVININFLFTLCLGFAFSATHAQVSGTFTINSAAPTDVPGGGTNFQTFSAAAAYLSSGTIVGPVTFNVVALSGPYTEQVVLNNIAGTAANPIIFNCNGVTLTFLSTNTNSRAGFKLNNTDYVTIDNLVVKPKAASTNQYGCGFHLLNDADNNTIKNCQVLSKVVTSLPEASTGVVINGNDKNPRDPGPNNCDNNLITQNVFDGCGYGLFLASDYNVSNPVFMDGNRVTKNTISNFYYTGIELDNNSNAVIDGNKFTGGDNLGGTVGIDLEKQAHKVSVINNRFYDWIIDPLFGFSELYGIVVNAQGVAGQENLIANNAMYNWSSGDQGMQYGITATGATYANIYHNTISLDDQTEVGEETYGVSLQNVSNINFMNNVVSVSRKTVGVNYGIYTDNVSPVFASDHNVIYVAKAVAPGKAFFGNWANNFADNLAIWQTNSGNDFFSTAVNPVFANAAGGNLAPNTQSIDNMGLNVGIGSDINAIARSTKSPDPGCLEYTSAPCGGPFVGGAPIITPDSAFCQGPTVEMAVIGNTAGGGQTYTWQTSTAQSGTYTNISGALDYPYLKVTPTSSFYYRVAIACGATTYYSSPMKVLVSTPLTPGTYTINKALPTGGINYNSFTDAVAALQCGLNGSVVFSVVSGSGPYNEQVTIPVVSTASNRTITFSGNGEKLTFATNSTKTSVLKLDGADYITIDSLNIVPQGATNGFGFGILITNDADNNTIKRCVIDLNQTSPSTNYGGIIMNAKENDPTNDAAENYCDNNLIAYNTVNGGFHGITCATKSLVSAGPTSVGNTIRGNKLYDNSGYGIYTAGSGNMLIDSNDISHPTRTSFSNTFFAIIAKNVNLGLTITKNRIHNLFEKAPANTNQLTGIAIITVPGDAAQPNVVSNNLLYSYKGLGLQEGLYTLSSNYLKFYHNTVSLEDTAAFSVNETRGFGLYGPSSVGVEFKNNSIVVKRGGDRQKYAIYLDQNDSGLVANYNNYYMRSPLGYDTVGYMGTRIYKTLDSWLFTRKDSSSINIDPVYNDIAKGDLTPTKLLFENRGFGVGITTDQQNNNRDASKPDIGAIEFTICSPLTNPVVTVEDAQPNIIKFAWNRVINSTGYRVSRDNLNWAIPSSGAQGLSHTVTGLKSTDTVTLWVKALGTRVDCPDYTSIKGAKALTDGVFVPNTFTPNGDGHNDVFQVYSAVTKTVRWMVFNQWGEKVFESNDINGTWDGFYKGKPQPVGVYVYVVSGMLSNGTKVTKKGTFNLVR
ncbi:hypothetical protein A4H97_26985 [Niastella yeongjuensis]|uniref:Right handed beta helix domain-containing protein n=1 Tax=Niastella yeongjuensis TaxID=354355 RepID=A0A1V9F0H7_9BACT|nr:right-handed parallel beta-helix repeat-containing protein [Niastella yeongjuensis]OQP51850.1 hypothetical protein A4H97_26985 [Niastella yeongjuensis]SEP44256.1 gliding motility-associated C-terminal domain-containing protein [Niastella yeongjuensis]